MSCCKTVTSRLAGRVIRLLCCLISVFVFSGLVLAQLPAPALVSEHESDSKDQIVKSLSSPDVKDRAWGAYLVGKRHYDDLIPNLLKLFDTGFKDQDYGTQLVYRCA